MSKPYKTVLVDQDGVLAAFASYNRIIMNDYMWLTYGEEAKQISQHQMIEDSKYDISELWEVDRDEWWRVIVQDSTFWLDIPMFPWAPDLIRRLRNICENLYVSTNPGVKDLKAPSQKAEWFHARKNLFNLETTDLMIGAQKQLMAKPGVLLIDDSKHNVDAFIKAGGEAVLVSSDWNCKNHGLHAVWSEITNYIDEKRT